MDTTILELGYESHCYDTFREMCREWFIKFNYPRILKIKEQCCQYSKKSELAYYKEIDDKEKQYFTNGDIRFRWIGKLGFCESKKTMAHCCRYFRHESNDVIEKFLHDKHGDLENAILNTENFVELWNQFEQWFEERRCRFMKKMDLDIQKLGSVSSKRSPNSHGSVANLLKILTKTMEKQGADITSIAKVQYAVCVQAGIYIPDEFIRDVAVSLDFETGNTDGQ